MTDQPMRVEDVSGIRSRISWGAVLAGAVVALASYLILTLFFSALGLSLTEWGVRANAVGIGAVVVAVLTIAVSLFVGGWVTTQLTAGETTREAVIHGVLTWAAVTALSLALIGMSVKAGYFALMNGALVAQQANTQDGRSWEEMARAMGVSQARIDAAKEGLTAENVRAQAADPAIQERAREGATVATWATLVGTLFAMGAAIGGALCGRGAQFRLFPAATAARTDIIIAR